VERLEYGRASVRADLGPSVHAVPAGGRSVRVRVRPAAISREPPKVRANHDESERRVELVANPKVR
jgi:hypothetical protein